MNNQFTLFIYNHSPIGTQNVLCSLAGWNYNRLRYGAEFHRWVEFYAQSRTWSEADLREYQREQVGILLRECYDSVPYYAEKWREARQAPSDFKDLPDLARFPCTTKEDVFQATDRMIATTVTRSRLFKGMTGGSTGMPLVCYLLPEELQRHYAIFWDRGRPGVTRGDRYAAFQGKEIVPPGQKRPPYWRENRASNQRLYSMRYLAPEKLQAYAESLNDDPPFVYYQGYVSFMSVVAEYMLDHGLVPRVPPKAVFATSEQVTTAARGLFEKAWKTRVWDEYCQGERCAFIMECEHGNRHAQMDYGVIEYEPVGREGDLRLAEMICTGFIPHASPLIRYRIGDRVLIDEKAVCPCGRPGPVIKAIRGRTSEYLITPDGRKYPHISLIVDLLHNVRRTQVEQERPDEILVRVVPFPEYTPEDERHLIRCFQERIGGGIGVKVQYVRDLVRLPNGKVPSIINRVPGRESAGGRFVEAD